MTANEIANNFYSGSLYQTNGPAFNAVPFDPAQVTAMQLGLGSLYFSDANNGTFTYMTGGITQTKNITREIFGPLPVCATATASLSAATNYQDLWWAAPAGVESGWGVNLTQEGTTIFATWFTYDGEHNPLWYSVCLRIIGAGHGSVLQLESGSYVDITGAPPNSESGLVLYTSTDGLTFGSP